MKCTELVSNISYIYMVQAYINDEIVRGGGDEDGGQERVRIRISAGNRNSNGSKHNYLLI